jgi:hypothetical protein
VQASLREHQLHQRARICQFGPNLRLVFIGPIESVDVRDPDENLIELARYGDDVD